MIRALRELEDTRFWADLILLFRDALVWHFPVLESREYLHDLFLDVVVLFLMSPEHFIGNTFGPVILF